MAKVSVDAAGMKALLESAKRIGTEDNWQKLAVDWMEMAEKEITRLKKEIISHAG